MLRGEYLQEFYGLASQNSVTANFPPINAMYNRKRAMCCAMRKNWDFYFKRFAAQLTELNNYLPLFPGSSNSMKMAPDELNKIILHDIPNGWEKKSYLYYLNFKEKYYEDTCDMFERIEIAKQK